MAEHTITLELNETLILDELLYRLPSKLRFKKGDTLYLKLVYTCGSYLDAPVFPLISSYFKWLRDNYINVVTSFDSSGECGFHYAGRIGMFDHLGMEYSYPYQTHNPGGRFIPITHIGNKGYGVDEQFIDKLGTDLGIPEDMKASIYFSVGEMVANIRQHASVESGAMIFGQSYPSRKETTLIVVDPGRGIHSAFSAGSKLEYTSLTEAECLEKCIEHGVTCGNGRGHGLFLISEFLSRNLGELRVISGEHILSVINGVKSVKKCHRWEGTIVICTFNLDNKVDFNEVLTSNGHEPSEPLW